ncbi:Homocysteine S-methyltransferase 1 [Aphelenchoides fujianensis]|nr:Homocysteine S-methyltransferase 1 [Aphelenchoides fujianensis]
MTAAHDPFEPVEFGRLQVLDGGMGSTIERMGFDASSHVAWGSGANITNPELVLAAHKAFIEAGATVILTNTYQANQKRLRQKMSDEEALDYLKKGVELAKRAVEESGRAVRIVGSIGSYATYLKDGSEYRGDYLNTPGFDVQLIRQNYELQARALLDLGVRFLAFETIPTVVEAQHARGVLESFGCDGWISAQCRDGEHLANGDRFADFAAAVSDSPRVRAIGVNCTSPECVRSLLTSAQSATNGKPFVVYPNSGEQFDCEEKKYFGDAKVGRMLDELPEWERLGVRLVGGCCRVLPEDLRKIAKRVDEIRSASPAS